MTFARYALYYAPPADAAWSQWATQWLGWDMEAGCPLPPPDMDGADMSPSEIAEITATPRKYGLHATIKPPMRLAAGCTEADLRASCAGLAASLAPVTLDGLHPVALGRFLALRPTGDESALNALAATCVRTLDPLRAQATEAELARRRAAGLTPAQDDNLTRWGYPYVMEAFRFHITLTGKLAKPQRAQVEALLTRQLVPLLPQPFAIKDLALVGEDDTGRFHLLHRYPLSA